MSVNRFLKVAKKIEEDSRKRSDDSPSVHGGGGHDESNWIVSYADMMTLLCGFFIMMYALGSMKPAEVETVKESVAKEFYGPYIRPHDELGKFMTQVLQETGIEQQASVRVDPFGVAVVFESAVFFDTLSADVKPQGRFVLEKLIDGLSRKQLELKKKYRIVVEGHTDQRPVIGGNFPSNWELSGARASRVVRMFLDQGFTPSRLVAMGYADTQPELPARRPSGEWDEAALNKNRRVVVRIMEDDAKMMPILENEVPPSAGTTAAKPIH